MTQPAPFTFTFEEDGYVVTIARGAGTVEVRDSNGVVRRVEIGVRGSYRVAHDAYPGDGWDGQTAEEVAAFEALADLRGLHECGVVQLELCGAAIAHLLTAPFTRDHTVSVTRRGDVIHNGAKKRAPTIGSEMVEWVPASVLAPL